MSETPLPHRDGPIRRGDETSYRVRRAQNGEAESLAWLAARFTPLLVIQAEHRLTKSLRRHYDPEDIVGDVWCAAIPKIAAIEARDGSHAMAVLKYLSTILMNRLRRLAEREIAGLPPEPFGEGMGDAASQIPDDVTGVLSRAVKSEVRGRVRALIDELDPKDREVVLFVGIEQRPLADVARKLETTPKLLSQRYCRALARLKKLLPDSVFADLAEIVVGEPGDE